MAHYDVFNGDADGICALQQIRLSHPKQTTLITGLKRDIQLLKSFEAEEQDTITVLDISFDKNRNEVESLVKRGIAIDYFDHHFAGDIPEAEHLNVHINTDANTCTSLIMNQYLSGAQARWAVVGAFGDNLDESALSLAKTINLSDDEIQQMKQLGICLNYNGYGFALDDLIFHPKDLYSKVSPYANPMDFISSDEAYATLSSQYFKDLESASNTQAEHTSEHADVIFLPNEAWAKRVVGVFGNDLARQNKDKGFALLIPFDDDEGKKYRVSVRAPLNNKTGADEICRQFATGGGRKAAAGINALASDELDRFIQVFTEFYN